MSGPRPGPAPLRSRPGRREEEGGSTRTARGAALLQAPVRVSGAGSGDQNRTGGSDPTPGVNTHPGPALAPPPPGIVIAESQGDLERRAGARGQGPWCDSCGRARIFSLNPTVPCRLRNPRTFSLPDSGGSVPKKQPESPGQRVPAGSGAASSLHSASAWGQRTCHCAACPQPGR